MNRPSPATPVVAFGLVAAVGLALLPLVPGLGPDLAAEAGRGARAREILEGRALRQPSPAAVAEGPIYAFFLAPFFALADPLPAVQTAQVLLTASTVLPLWLLFRDRIPVAAQAPVLALALLPPPVLLPALRLAPEALAVPLVAWWLVAARRATTAGTPLAALAWGGLTGLTVLAVPGTVLLVPLLAWALTAGRRGALALPIAVGGLATVVGPWMAGGWFPRVAPPDATGLGASAGLLLLGTGIFLLPAALSELARADRGILATIVLALALPPGRSDSGALAATLPLLVPLGFAGLGRRAPWSHAATCFLALAFVAALPPDAGGGLSERALGRIGILLVLAWLVGSAAILARLGARRSLLALAVLGVLVPLVPRALATRRAAETSRPFHAIGRWLDRRGPDGPVHVASPDPRLPAIIVLESGRPIVEDPEDAAIQLSPEPLPGRRAVRVFRLDGVAYHLYVR